MAYPHCLYVEALSDTVSISPGDIKGINQSAQVKMSLKRSDEYFTQSFLLRRGDKLCIGSAEFVVDVEESIEPPLVASREVSNSDGTKLQDEEGRGIDTRVKEDQVQVTSSDMVNEFDDVGFQNESESAAKLRNNEEVSFQVSETPRRRKKTVMDFGVRAWNDEVSQPDMSEALEDAQKSAQEHSRDLRDGLLSLDAEAEIADSSARRSLFGYGATDIRTNTADVTTNRDEVVQGQESTEMQDDSDKVAMKPISIATNDAPINQEDSVGSSLPSHAMTALQIMGPPRSKRRPDGDGDAEGGRPRKKAKSVRDASDAAVHVVVPSQADVRSEAQGTSPPTSTSSSSRKPRSGGYDGPAPRILFSGSAVPENPLLLRYLLSQGAEKVESVEHSKSNFLCVGKGKMAKTAKLLLAVGLRHTIVTDEWVTASCKAGHLLDPTAYFPHEPTKEKEWLGDAHPGLLWTVQQRRQRVFKGFRLFFTPQLRKEYGQGFSDLRHICLVMGAQEIVSRAAATEKQKDDVIALASANNDPEVKKLGRSKVKCYGKDLISASILRGRLDLDSAEFVLELDDKVKGGRGRPR